MLKTLLTLWAFIFYVGNNIMMNVCDNFFFLSVCFSEKVIGVVVDAVGQLGRSPDRHQKGAGPSSDGGMFFILLIIMLINVIFILVHVNLLAKKNCLLLC